MTVPAFPWAIDMTSFAGMVSLLFVLRPRLRIANVVVMIEALNH